MCLYTCYLYSKFGSPNPNLKVIYSCIGNVQARIDSGIDKHLQVPSVFNSRVQLCACTTKYYTFNQWYLINRGAQIFILRAELCDIHVLNNSLLNKYGENSIITRELEITYPCACCIGRRGFILQINDSHDLQNRLTNYSSQLLSQLSNK